MKKSIILFAVLLFFIPVNGLVIAQEAPSPPEGQGRNRMAPPSPRRPSIPPPGMGLRGPGKWWKNSELMQKIGVTDDQVQKMEKIFQDSRMQLIDVRAALEKQEAVLEPLIEADQPDEAKVLAQIDRVAQARANLEKANSQMLLALRRVLTVEQWKQLRTVPGITPTHDGRGFGPPAPAPAAPPTPPPPPR